MGVAGLGMSEVLGPLVHRFLDRLFRGFGTSVGLPHVMSSIVGPACFGKGLGSTAKEIWRAVQFINKQVVSCLPPPPHRRLFLPALRLRHDSWLCEGPGRCASASLALCLFLRDVGSLSPTASIYIYIYIYIHTFFLYIYIYIYREYVSIYIYIY